MPNSLLYNVYEYKASGSYYKCMSFDPFTHLYMVHRWNIARDSAHSSGQVMSWSKKDIIAAVKTGTLTLCYDAHASQPQAPGPSNPTSKWVNEELYAMLGGDYEKFKSSNSKLECTCESQNLFNFGCKCGAFQAERRKGK